MAARRGLGTLDRSRRGGGRRRGPPRAALGQTARLARALQPGVAGQRQPECASGKLVPLHGTDRHFAVAKALPGRCRRPGLLGGAAHPCRRASQGVSLDGRTRQGDRAAQRRESDGGGKPHPLPRRAVPEAVGTPSGRKCPRFPGLLAGRPVKCPVGRPRNDGDTLDGIRLPG